MSEETLHEQTLRIMVEQNINWSEARRTAVRMRRLNRLKKEKLDARK